MARHARNNSSADVAEEKELIRVAIFYKNFNRVIDAAAHLGVKTYKGWACGQICRNELEIDELLELKAPIEVFSRYVD